MHLQHYVQTEITATNWETCFFWVNKWSGAHCPRGDDLNNKFNFLFDIVNTIVEIFEMQLLKFGLEEEYVDDFIVVVHVQRVINLIMTNLKIFIFLIIF